MQSFSSGRMSAGVSPTGGRYLEDGLAVPGKHLVSVRDKQLKSITILRSTGSIACGSFQIHFSSKPLKV